MSKNWTNEEINDAIDNIQVALSSIRSLFIENIGITKEDEDIQCIQDVVNYLLEKIK